MIIEMEKVMAGRKQLFVVHSHNQVLEAWESCPGANVFSLDYHTDTREAFGNYAFWRADSEAKAGRCEDPEARKTELMDQKIRAYLDGNSTIRDINDNLKHDEHLDFAVRTRMIGCAFVLAKNRNYQSSNPNVYIAGNQSEYMGEGIIEYSPSCVPGCSKKIHDEECSRLLADSSIEDTVLSVAMTKAETFHPDFFENYILDIDCDYFNTERSLRPGTSAVFGELVRKASMITIALEPECVKICRFEGSILDSESILEALTAIIEGI